MLSPMVCPHAGRLPPGRHQRPPGLQWLPPQVTDQSVTDRPVTTGWTSKLLQAERKFPLGNAPPGARTGAAPGGPVTAPAPGAGGARRRRPPPPARTTARAAEI